MNQTKKCSKCGEVKGVGEFYRDITRVGGLHSQCKTCGLPQRRAYYLAHLKERQAYRQVYYQTHREELRTKGRAYHQAHKEAKRAYRQKHKTRYQEWFLNYNQTPKKIYLNIRLRSLKKGWSNIISLEKFIIWYSNEIKQCYYCDIPLEEMVRQQKRPGGGIIRRLEIDRIDNNKGYIEGNLALACHICNSSHKGPYFNGEFREIAQKYIKPKWQSLVSAREVLNETAAVSSGPQD